MRRLSFPALDTIHIGDAVSTLSSWPRHFVDLMVTDPPYGNDAAYGRRKRRITGDEHPLAGLQGIAAAYRVLKQDASAYVFCGASHIGIWEHFLGRYTKFRLREILVWDKRQPGFGSTFRRSFECVLVLEKGSPSYRHQGTPTLMPVPRTDTHMHPHAKPVVLLERLIRLSSDPGGLVLDPFAGSGSTCVAAANLGRRFLAIEIEPDYAQDARARLRKSA